MLILLSPAKTLDYKTPAPVKSYSQPDYLEKAQKLIDILRAYPPFEIAKLMHISDALAVQNAERFSSWHLPFTVENSKQALFAFKGDVYEGLDAMHLSQAALNYAQQHVRILSGLYGILRPLDLMQPYRLEMGTKLVNSEGKNLYAFWGKEITLGLNHLLSQANGVVINLASEEYFKAIQLPHLQGRVIYPVFEDYKNGQYKIISFYAKRARGLMVNFAATHQINEPEKLKAFDMEGYCFIEDASDASRWIFRRRV